MVDAKGTKAVSDKLFYGNHARREGLTFSPFLCRAKNAIPLKINYRYREFYAILTAET
jgi:hypothetical protein